MLASPPPSGPTAILLQTADDTRLHALAAPGQKYPPPALPATSLPQTRAFRSQQLLAPTRASRTCRVPPAHSAWIHLKAQTPYHDPEPPPLRPSPSRLPSTLRDLAWRSAACLLDRICPGFPARVTTH